MAEIPKRNFTGGELAPALHARADLVKYQTGVAGLRNFLIHPEGGVSNRGGTHFIDEIKNSAAEARLLPFEFNKDQAYVIETGNLYMRVVRNDGLVLEPAIAITGASQTNPVVITAANSYANGDEVFITGVNGMTQLNVNRYIVAGVTGANFQLSGINGTAYSAYTSGGSVARIFTLVTPYVQADLELLKFTQSADVMTVTHRNYEQRNLSRTDHHVWTLSVISYNPTIAAPTGLTAAEGGPGGGASTKTYEYVVTAVNVTGEESLQSTAASDLANSLDGTHYNQMVWNSVTGAEFYNVYKAESEVSDIYGWIGESKTVSFRDYNLLPDVSDTPAEARNPFSGAGNYPGCVTYYQQRQIFGSTYNNIETVYASQSGNFTSMRVSRPTRADDAIERTIASKTVNEIRHFVDLDSLLVLTSGGVWKMTEGQDDVLTPASAGFRRQSSFGCSNVPPVIIGDTALFVEISGSRIRDLSYSFQSDKFGGDDVSLFATHLFKGRTVKQWAYAREPDGIVWVVMSDGALIGLTYQREHQVWGWHRHDTDGLFESVAVIPDGAIDAVYFIVKRTINGQTRRYIEKLDYRQQLTAEESFFVDCGLTYSGVAADNITGLDHLEGKTVVALADGVVVDNLVVTNGAVTLTFEAELVHVGLPYLPDIETLDIDMAEAQVTSVRGKNKSVHSVTVKMLNSRGGAIGPSFDKLVEFRPRDVSDSYDPVALKSYEVYQQLENNWSQFGKVFIRQPYPLPLTILSIVPDFSVG